MFLTIKLCTYAKLNCFSIEQIIYIKIDLALTNLQRLICHQAKQTKPHTHTHTHTHTHIYMYIAHEVFQMKEEP